MAEIKVPIQVNLPDDWVEQIVNRLRNDPEAEWVEIIRCKDCKHWREGTSFSYCDKLHGMGVLDALDYMTAEDDYCSMAERRGEQDG
jgi:hypothetical protein